MTPANKYAERAREIVFALSDVDARWSDETLIARALEQAALEGRMEAESILKELAIFPVQSRATIWDHPLQMKLQRWFTETEELRARLAELMEGR